MKSLGYIIFSASVFCLPTAAIAVAPHQGNGIFGDLVSDAELSQMRGRFVEGNSIVFFGVSMRTDWWLADGTLHEMEMRFDIDFSGNSFLPTLNLFKAAPATTTSEVEETIHTGTPGTVVNESLDDISGIVQNIQVAGDGNAVLNDVTWEITDEEVAETAETLEPIATVNSTTTSSDNVTTQVQVQSNQVGYSINVPGQGVVKQEISSDAMRGLVQSTQLTGDINRVLNQMHLQIQVDPVKNTLNLNNLRNTLSNLRGLN